MTPTCEKSSENELRDPLYAVVMAGGPGSRLWPESRPSRPKPFLPLAPDGRTLIAATLERFEPLVPRDRRFVVAARAMKELFFETLPGFDSTRVLFEPASRNTALCAAWGALAVASFDPNATMIVAPSDHWIGGEEALRRVLADAARLVEEDPTRLVTLGVEPTYPAECYGYVEKGGALGGAIEGYEVAQFREKPSRERAQAFLETKRFYWNAGIFVWKASRYLDLLKRFEPTLVKTLETLEARVHICASEGRRVDEDAEFIEAFAKGKSVSIDYAVLERASNVVLVPASSFEWNDVGTFAELERVGATGTATSAVVEVDGSGNYARIVGDAAGRKKVVAFSGVSDLLVVDAGDALLVAQKGDEEGMKRLVARLKELGLYDLL